MKPLQGEEEEDIQMPVQLLSRLSFGEALPTKDITPH